MSVYTREELVAGSVALSAPFALAITPAVAREALKQHCAMEDLTERELVCTYVALHWMIEREHHLEKGLAHGPYVDSLPERGVLHTPLHFNHAEKSLMTGTNLVAATTERQSAWRLEWERCRTSFKSPLGNSLTWEHYLTASTHLSSRAFPSTLLNESPSLVATPSSHPILLPIIDSLNHARAHPVSWSVSNLPVPTIAIVQRGAVPAGAEVLNNYGAKPNAELVLGYGFALPDNPDDTIALKVAGSTSARREVGRAAQGIPELLGDLQAAMRAQGGMDGIEGEEDDYEMRLALEYDALSMLQEMLQRRAGELPHLESHDPAAGVRESVWTMMFHYVKGQSEILRDAQKWVVDQLLRVREQAAQLGIDLDEDGDDKDLHNC
ncbi:SET domain-containing protein [Auriculariales sp. MPI-PUGE-AT-0066]|nr:SET domain-containing protein [Auriculariales sp. MPI-PUGE-AT-0066]